MNFVNGSVATIDLNALVHNYKYAKSLAPQSRTMAVIKADAYGHGMHAAATALDSVADGIAVAKLGEGVALREAGIGNPNLLILQGAADDDAWSLALTHNLTVVVQNESQLNYAISDKWPASRSVWVHVDTGMHRLGMHPDTCDAVLPRVLEKFGRKNVVLSSHFACSDEVGLPHNAAQLAVMHRLRTKHDVEWSIANSGAIMTMPEAHGTWNRAGFMIYGNSPLDRATLPNGTHPCDAVLRPVMSMTAPVIAVNHVRSGEPVGYGRTFTPTRDSVIAVVSVGYGDGYPRHARNGTPVHVLRRSGNNDSSLPPRVAALAGRVSMDMITVDVTDLVQTEGASAGDDGDRGVQVGDWVLLWGRPPGQTTGGLSVNEVADWAGTIGYEVLTRLMPRTRRTYQHQRAPEQHV